MTHNIWSDTKPEFTEECILITASWNGKEWNYNSFEIIKADGEGEDGKRGWYWGIFDFWGSEWGDLFDLKASKYYTVPLLK